MSAFDYDLFVIGAGSGGVRASRIAASHGARVGIAEEYRIGGTCVIRGCVPKKLLVYGSHFAAELQDAQHYGWTIEGLSFDWATLRDAVLRDVDRLNAAYTTTLDNNNVQRFLERATIAGPNRIRLASGREISAGKILIAVGATPVLPPFSGAEHCITSNEVFHLDVLPRHIAIVGGGYIAMEFAGIFNALGCEVTVINRSDTLLRGYDESLVARLLQITKARGIGYRFDSQIDRVERQADGRLIIHHSTAHDPLICDQVLVAAGRLPKTDGLGLENVGIATSPRGAINIDANFATSAANVFAVGDVTDRVQLTPMAIREGQAFADTQFGGKPATVDYSFIPSAVFSQPPIAAVGMTEHEAMAAGFSVKVYSSDFRPMKNTFSETMERGLYRMIVDEASNRILGLHLIGPEAPEILQAAAIAVRAGLTMADFDATVALHPSMAEELVLMR